MKKVKHKKLWTALAVIAAAVVIPLACNWKLVKIIARNLFQVSIEIDDSEWEGGTSYLGVAYAEDSENQYLNLYVPDTDSDEELPLIILVHGGGFIMNDLESEQAVKMYQYFRDHGYACATINYRLAQEAEWPGAIEDVKAAVRFLRANAEVYGYSAENFTIWGESAGGYLAVIAAVTTDDEFDGVSFIGEEELKEPVSGEIATVIDFYGCIDFYTTADEFADQGIPEIVISLSNFWMDPDDMDGYESCEEFWLRSTLEELTEEEKTLSIPTYYLEKNSEELQDLEIIIYHGLYDISVPYMQSVNLAETASDLLGEDAVQITLFDGYVHADDRLYTEEQLDVVLAALE